MNPGHLAIWSLPGGLPDAWDRLRWAPRASSFHHLLSFPALCLEAPSSSCWAILSLLLLPHSAFSWPASFTRSTLQMEPDSKPCHHATAWPWPLPCLHVAASSWICASSTSDHSLHSGQHCPFKARGVVHVPPSAPNCPWVSFHSMTTWPWSLLRPTSHHVVPTDTQGSVLVWVHAKPR